MEKLDNTTIKFITSNINKFKYYKHSEEKFKQIKIDNMYTPYLISSYGRIFSLKKDMYNPYEMVPQLIKNSGYMKISLHTDNGPKFVSVHRLVALHFIKNKNNLPVVNHLDGNKTNNMRWNLEWSTQKDNILHAHQTGLANSKGENNCNNVYSLNQIMNVCAMISNNCSIPDIEKMTGVSRFEIYNILYGLVWRDVSKKYDFSNFNYGKEKSQTDENIRRVNQACKLLEQNELTLKEISSKTGLSYTVVRKISIGEIYKYISKNYKLTNFNNKIKYKKRNRL